MGGGSLLYCIYQDGPVRQVHSTEFRSVPIATCGVDEIPGADAQGEVAEGDEVKNVTYGVIVCGVP